MTHRNPSAAARDEGPLSANDIAGLARRVPQIDPARYLDEQARLAYRDALTRWPVLAKLMGLLE
ncbi:hypothetical protein NX868_25480 [Burkholderia thailandensis]|uniref:Cellulose biosynthesis protein BcsR n=1 Tax=Burkholderia thailandensis TaxID=57975 RepID=A0AAW9CPC9_BURTH|nr:hypothetical protein [Burkholderia thailandensis]MCS3392261.1 hypothetical protein [Burkholderia thailandensis]MCS6427907.1 hypothetical protein [Burkholderia thailandensis]MCS6453466.1 hypothetical protein [Burkholderia thailandensis]MCS6467074.1 hypothetical protein [Burkholderia thailandensis]MCS6485612.1 hypothetical protein [Burkholderia thailandensis]